MQRVPTTFGREQHGSSVAQAAGIALFVAVLVLAMFGILDRLQTGVMDGLRCYIGAFDSGGCGGSATTRGNGSPIPDGLAQPPPALEPPAAPAGQPEDAPPAVLVSQPVAGAPPAPSRGQRAGSLALDVIPIVGDIKGLWESATGTDTVTGEQLSRMERLLGLAGIIGLAELRYLAKGDDLLSLFRFGRRSSDDLLAACARGDAAPRGKAPGLAKPALSCWDDIIFAGRSADEIAEMNRYMAKWDAATFESVAHSIAYHAAKHGDGDALKYLRRAENFNRRGARRIPLPDDAVRYEKGNGEFIIERNGKIITYGRNP